MPTRVTKTVVIKLQTPGSIPESVKLPIGSTVSDLRSERNLSNYIVSVNGHEVANDYAFAKNDIVRIGVKTKNAS